MKMVMATGCELWTSTPGSIPASGSRVNFAILEAGCGSDSLRESGRATLATPADVLEDFKIQSASTALISPHSARSEDRPPDLYT